MPKLKAKKTVRKAGRKPADVLRQTWSATLEALGSAERKVEKQIRVLLKNNTISGKEAQALLKGFASRLQSERKRAMKQLEARLKTLQTRVSKERKVVGRRIGEGVQRTLAALNIPSRREVSELTRKVDELSRKIDTFKRRVGTPRRHATPPPAPAQA